MFTISSAREIFSKDQAALHLKGLKQNGALKMISDMMMMQYLTFKAC